MFFKCEISNQYSYTIDVGPEIDEYRLHIVYKNGDYRVLGQYTDFQTASYVANYHYQETNRHNQNLFKLEFAGCCYLLPNKTDKGYQIMASSPLFYPRSIKKFPNLIVQIGEFFLEFLDEISRNMKLLSAYEKPTNSLILEEFQKYVLQASVEEYSIKRRHEFIKKAFNYYRDPKTKGKIIGSEVKGQYS